MTLFLLLALAATLLAVASLVIPLWAKGTGQSRLAPGLVAFFAVPAALMAVYWLVGEPQGIDRPATATDDLRDQLIEIANDLERNPDNATGWLALGMAYKNIEAFSSAEHALRRALYIDEDNDTVQVELAETLIFTSAEAPPPEAERLLDRALEQNRASQKAIWLKGVVAFSNGRFQEAISAWQGLLASLPEDASIRASVERQIDLARQQIEPARSNRAIQLSIELDPALTDGVTGTETVFVIAQAVDGPNTPLAARKLTVNELPTTLTLSDQDAMVDGLTMSQFGELEFTARVSSSGEVAPEPGDLEGRVRVGPTTQATLVIDTRLQ